VIARIFCLALALGLLASCGNVAGRPLPVVHADDPTWALMPDHLDAGSLPR
jgi:hypothetical protein